MDLLPQNYLGVIFLNADSRSSSGLGVRSGMLYTQSAQYMFLMLITVSESLHQGLVLKYSAHSESAVAFRVEGCTQEGSEYDGKRIEFGENSPR